MDIALLVARLVLAVVFLVAGLAKLLDSSGSRKAVADFGVPVQIADPVGILLPIAEIAIAVCLIPTGWAWWSAIAALALVLLFIAGIAYNLSIGRKPDCHCFGQLHSEPVGWPTLIRNGILAVIAAFVVWQGVDDAGLSAWQWFAHSSSATKAAIVLALVALLMAGVLGWTVLHLLGQNGRVLLRLDEIEAAVAATGAAPQPAAPPAPGLPVGSPAPAFSLSGLHGETMTLDALRAGGKPVMLLFSDPGCGPCNALLPEVGKWQREHAAQLTLAVLSRGTVDANKAKSAEHGLSTVLLQKDREVAQAYEAHGTPSAVMVNADGRIISPVSGGADAIRALLTRTVGAPASAPAPARSAAQAPVPAPAPVPAANGNGNGNAAPPATQPGARAVGQAAPDVKLPDINGKQISLTDFKGSKTAVLFWNPGCGFCRRMLDDLKAWEANPPAGSPKLLVVSTGTAEANKEMGIRSPMLLDEGFSVGRGFGASGTPSAVLVDEQGRVASGVAVGQPGVMALLTGQPVAPPAPAPAAPPSPQTGQPAPAINLPDLDGKQVTLDSFKGHKSLVLFWNPGCGFCRRMLDDLKAWEANPPKGAPKLLVVSTGTTEANKEMGIKAPMLLDEGFSVGRAFGASGTPSAVLVDAQGKIASEVAVGADAVFALAGAPKQPATV